MSIVEVDRIRAVKQFNEINFNLNKGLHEILELATSICQVPVAFITLLDENTQWFKVTRGFAIEKVPRNVSFCQHTILHQEVMVVNDTTKDERFINSPFISDPLNVRFYAGAPLTTTTGNNIGTLCILDAQAKSFPDDKSHLLGILARQSTHLMELNLSLKLLNEKTAQITVQNDALLEIAFTQSHEFRKPLANIMGLMSIMKADDYTSTREYLEYMDEAVTELDEKVKMVVKHTDIASNIIALQSATLR